MMNTYHISTTLQHAATRCNSISYIGLAYMHILYLTTWWEDIETASWENVVCINMVTRLPSVWEEIYGEENGESVCG